MMNRELLLRELNTCFSHCQGLTLHEFNAVINLIVDNASDHVDYCDNLQRARYFYEGAAWVISNDLNFADEARQSDVEFLTFEFSMIYGDEY